MYHKCECVAIGEAYGVLWLSGVQWRLSGSSALLPCSTITGAFIGKIEDTGVE